MLQPEMRNMSYIDPSVDSHRPASTKSLDVSHVLASIFKDVYTKDSGRDALSNLLKTRSGGSSYHDRYVEELQQIHSEYNRTVTEADMLERHIICARNRAAVAEKEAYRRIKENMEDVDDRQILVAVDSAFSWCVDSELLHKNNLISPQDYLTIQKPRVEAPRAAKLDPARPTVAFSMHVSREPQDDSYTLIPGPETVESDFSLTLDSSPDAEKRKEMPKKTKPRPKWKDEPSAQDRMEGLSKLQMLKDRQNFLRNPRFLPPKSQQGGSSLVQPRHKERSSDAPVPIFVAEPPALSFTCYDMGQIYEMTLELKNVTSASRHIRVIPPTTSYFSMGLGRFPGEGGIVAPGMNCKYTVRFAPDSLGDYEDFITVEMQMGQMFVVPIVAKRPAPVLTLPRVLDCGYCLIGGVKFVKFPCKNVGASCGTFCIIPKSQWPPTNLRSVARTHFSEEPPFAVSPSSFWLQPGETTVVEVAFFPTTAEKNSKVFTILCDNCQVKDIAVEGEGQLVALEFVPVCGKIEHPGLGEVHDLTAEYFLRCGPCNPHSVKQKKIIIRNNVHVELPFHWRIMKPNLHPLFPGETPEPSHIQFHLATDDAFQVSPPFGVLAACQEAEFLLTFCPREIRDYHSVCHLVLNDLAQLPPQPTHDSGLQPVHTCSRVSNVVAMEIEVKGSTEPYKVLLEPYAIVIPGEVYIFTTTRRKFMMWNYSKTCITFQWEKMSSSSLIMEVEPPTGRIEENECLDFTLFVTGLKPAKVMTGLVCQIQHHPNPVTLVVEVAFKGPIVTLSVPSVDFGLMKLGQRAQTSLLLTNVTHVEATWTMKESQEHKDSQISMEPCRGVLAPLASCSVDVLFVPRFCRQYETELQLSVQDGLGCHLLVQAVVQSPQVCLLKCELLLSELYIGVPARGTVTLYNQTTLPSHFSWTDQLHGKHAAQCTASFDPSSGTLGPNSSMEITVNFTSHTDMELTEIAAVCEVQGMNCPLVLSITAPKAKTLSVSYSLPNVSSAPGDERPSALLLDFGGDVKLKRVVTKQLPITNQTAIPAPFTVEVEYFACSVSKSNVQSEKRYVKKPLHPIQAKKIEEKADNEFISSLLDRGKGVGFHVSPHAGILGAFETLTVDITAYNDMWGEYRDHLICKVGDLEAVLIPMQMTVTGCPLYFQMTGPRPDDQNQGPIVRFGIHVSGGDTVSRCLRINNPTAFDIRMDWETYNTEPKDGISDGRGQAASERNAMPESEGSRSSHQSTTDGGDEENASKDLCKEEDTCLAEEPPSVRNNISDYPFYITPQKTVIPAKGSSTIYASFTPLTPSESASETKCVGVALGFLSLDAEMAACVPGKVKRAQGLDVEPVRMDLIAVVKPAVLSVQIDDDEEMLEFRTSAGDFLRGGSEEELVIREFDVTQTLHLINNIETPLHFRLGTLPPFTVFKPQCRVGTVSSSSPPTGDSQYLVLQPKHKMQVKVAFQGSPSFLDYADHADEELPAGVSLIHSDNRQRKLRLQQNLQIHYSNNTVQSVPLRAHLDLATMHLSTENIDFGVCYVGQVKTCFVSLYSHGSRTSWKSLIESDDVDSHVFKVAPDFGFLRLKELSTSCREGVQISFTPSEGRDFRAVVVIRSPLVKTALTLQLQGTGSFDERYRTDVSS